MDFAHTLRFSLIAAVSCVTIFTAGQSAQAQPTDAQRSAIRSACRSDYMANCSSVTPGGVEALQCLQRNEAKLSGACRSAVNAISASAKPAEPAAATAAPAAEPKAAATPAEKPAAAPAKPATAAAPSSQPAQGTAPVKRVTTTSKPSVIAPAAAAVTGPPPAPPPLPLADIPPRFELAVVRSCRAETRTVCALPAGGGRILNCLAANQASVSPSCSLALDRARAAAR